MRIRSLRPELFSDPMVSRLHPVTRLIYIGMFFVADDHGRGWANAAFIKGQISPEEHPELDSSSIRRAFDELSRTLLVIFFDDPERSCLPGYPQVFQIVGWTNPEHHAFQRIDRASKESKFPAPPEDPFTPPDQGKLFTPRELNEDSSSIRRTIDEGSTMTRLLNREQGTGNREQGTDLKPLLSVSDFSDHPQRDSTNGTSLSEETSDAVGGADAPESVTEDLPLESTRKQPSRADIRALTQVRAEVWELKGSTDGVAAQRAITKAWKWVPKHEDPLGYLTEAIKGARYWKTYVGHNDNGHPYSGWDNLLRKAERVEAAVEIYRANRHLPPLPLVRGQPAQQRRGNPGTVKDGRPDHITPEAWAAMTYDQKMESIG